MANRLRTGQVARFSRIACVALCMLQPLGCGEDAPPPERGDSGESEMPVVRREAPPRELEPVTQPAAVAIPEPEAPKRAEVKVPDPRLAETLDPEDSARRAEEISDLNAAGDDLDRLLDTLASDPDPAVRVAAADMLAESGRREAIVGLLGALHDPSRAVVLQALETLSLVGEADIAPWIEPLLDHDDPEIRQLAEDALYFVDEGDFDEAGSGPGRPLEWGGASEPDSGFESNVDSAGDSAE